MKERRAMKLMNQRQEGHVLLGSLMLIFLLGIAGVTSLYLAGQDGPGISAMKEDNVAQQLADGAADIVMSGSPDRVATRAPMAGCLENGRENPGAGPRSSAKPGVHSLPGLLINPTS